MKKLLAVVFIGLSLNAASQIKGNFEELNPIINEFKISITEVKNGAFENMDDIILTYKGNKCVLTGDVYDALMKKDLTVIKKMQMSANSYVIYNKSAAKIAEKLRKHLAAYSSGLMTKIRMAEWKKDTKACEAILNKMDKLPYASSELFFWQINIKDVKLHNAIHDWVELSKDKLGI